MRPTQIFTLISTVGVCLSPGVNATMGFSCLKAFQSLNPRRFIESIHQNSCDAGCQPRPAHWDQHGRELMRGLIEDGSAHIQIDERQDAIAEYMDRLFEGLRTKCEGKLDGAHMCQDSEQVGETMKCFDENTRFAAFRAAPGLLPYLSEDRCKRIDDYLNSPQLWDNDLPARAQTYANRCHEI